MKVLGVLILFGGVGLSFGVWLHDFRRLRIGACLPQAAPSRLPPELHALGAIVSSLGAMIIWRWAAGGAVLLLQAATVFVIPPILERLERLTRRRKRRDETKSNE